MQSKARPPLRGRWAARIPAPNRYTLPGAVGKQPLSRCKSALASRFGTSLRPPLEKVSHLAISAVVVISIRLCSRQSNPPPILPRNRIPCHS